MHPDLHRFLDNELPREALPPDLAAEAEMWERLVDAASEFAAPAPAWLEDRIMAALPATEKDSAFYRAWIWLANPQPVRLRPASVGLAAAFACLLLILTWPGRGPHGTEALHLAAETEGHVAEAVVYVQFVLTAEEAQSVAVAGDFNGWNAEVHPLVDPAGTGVWTGIIALPPGMHKYMFVVDGQRWVTDPRAERYVDDGFGMRNAIVAVNPPPRRSS